MSNNPGRVHRTSLSSMGRLSLGGSIRLHDLLEASDDEYGFVRADVERALDVRDATEDEIIGLEDAAMERKLPAEHVIPAGGEEPPSTSNANPSSSGHQSDGEHNEKVSIGSNESGGGKKEEQSKIGALFDKAKSKGRKLVGGHSRKKANSECTEDVSPCISVKSLEYAPNASTPSSSKKNTENIRRDSLPHSTKIDGGIKEENAASTEEKKSEAVQKNLERDVQGRVKRTSLVDPADPSDPFLVQSLVHKCRVLPFFRARLVIFGTLIAMTVASPGFITGILWGFYSAIIGFLYFFVSEPKSKEQETDNWLSSDEVIEEQDVKNGATKPVLSTVDAQGFGLGDGVVYRGWMNELRTRYSPASYHVNSAQSVLVRLEGSMLRICRPSKAVLKHAFYDDPTLKQAQPTMVSQTIYDLKDAQVTLRPKRLARRRWWSRKYPIHIRFSHASSALTEVDRSKIGAARGMKRSASMNPSPNIGSSMDERAYGGGGGGYESDGGYSAESESDEDPQTNEARAQVMRANSASDIREFNSAARGKTDKQKGRSIYLFVRAAREKERWFHLLREACAKSRTSTHLQRCTSAIVTSPSSASLPEYAVSMTKNEEENTSVAIEAIQIDNEDETDSKRDEIFDTPKRTRMPIEYEFLKYRSNYANFAREISTILSVSAPPKPEKNSTISVDLGTMKWQPGQSKVSSELVDSINVLATRIFFDFCRDEFWIRQVKQKIQSKLATIHLPYFIEKLELGELKFGTKAPRFDAVYTPKVDEWGTWIDFEMKYKGGIRLVLQTSVNLLKLQSGAHQVETEKRVSRWTESVRVTRYSDSDLPESPESSPDEDFGAKNNSEGTTKERTGKKILSIVERAAQSSFFQKAAKFSSVAKLIEDVSTTPLMLNVEVEEVEGPMTVNIPPPPSDRLWYAFRRRPLLRLRAVPQVGDRSVDLSTVSEWIETKLRVVLEKNLVCPNMDDIILPVLSGNDLLHMGYNK